MGYADQFYELGQEFARDAEARQADIDRSFAAILAEESRQAAARAEGEGREADLAEKEPPKPPPVKLGDKVDWDAEDDFWEFRSNRFKYQ
ncbi:Uncharacterised protein [Mycobacteroides abscessus subsp. bolletii]|uniref:hypothetical protein n=1 Tax=Mycobacteroides abscessus TaxID=36809 RepID=UPI00092C86E6|nr:hypothetical protein [Mycobacteroides abscessus]SIA50560.1 Uncharacterised protein [Mycobacteroides abscessus subsp. bolletii]SIB12062.1 Uncharacterised protein [Mycobacteroides abscessus subsp. bolletii]